MNVNDYQDSIFRWSCFDEEHSFIQETENLLGTEYKTAKEADTKISTEDGEYAFDISRNVEKKIFGLCGEYRDGTWHIEPCVWDKDRKDLVGCVTIKDWMWGDYTDEEPFTDDNVMERLKVEIEEVFGE